MLFSMSYKENAEERHLTVDKVASRLGVCPHTIRRMAKRGELPYLRVGQTGRLIRFRLEDIEAYENQNRFAL